MLFVNQFFQFVALNKYAEHLEANPREVQPCNCAMPTMEYLDIIKREEEAGRNPVLVCTDILHVVTHDFGKGDPFEVEDEDGTVREVSKENGMRMVCYAQVGPAELNRIATEWWRDNNPAHQKDSPLDEISKLHEGEGAVVQGTDGPVDVEDDDGEALLRQLLEEEGMD